MKHPFLKKFILPKKVETDPAVRLASDELIRLWGRGAYERATYLSWEEDFGLVSMSKPGHWWRVRHDIDRRNSHKISEPQVEGSAFGVSTSIVMGKIKQPDSADVCPQVYIDRNAGPMSAKSAASVPRSDPTQLRQARRSIMKHIALALAVLGSIVAFSTSDAKAFVCARGVFRAGCVGPHGAIGVRRGFGPVVYRRGAFFRGGIRRY